jgi:hypothetical protein
MTMPEAKQQRTLEINPAVEADVKTAIARARGNVATLAEMRKWARPITALKMTAADAMPRTDRRMKSEVVAIPHGYLVTVSFEEQPFGLCIHLSVGVDSSSKENRPSTGAVEQVFNLFGLEDPINGPYKTVRWIEENEPGRWFEHVLQVWPK